MDSHATMTFSNDSIFTSKSADRSGLICILNFWKFTNRNQRRNKLFFFISQNCFFVFVFFSLEKFNPYWLTQSQMLFFFISGTGNKKIHCFFLFPCQSLTSTNTKFWKIIDPKWEKNPVVGSFWNRWGTRSSKFYYFCVFRISNEFLFFYFQILFFLICFLFPWKS